MEELRGGFAPTSLVAPTGASWNDAGRRVRSAVQFRLAQAGANASPACWMSAFERLWPAVVEARTIGSSSLPSAPSRAQASAQPFSAHQSLSSAPSAVPNRSSSEPSTSLTLSGKRSVPCAKHPIS